MKLRRLSTAARLLRRRGAASPLVLLLVAIGCTPSGAGLLLGAAASSETTATEIVVDASAQRQHVSGFGASSAWTGPDDFTPDMIELLFSPDTGFGLSLLRMHIAPDGTTTETNTALMAQQYGVKVWASPWSPPGEWKTSGTDTEGGSLLPEDYQPWADRLANFVETEAQAGVQLYALSSQNEPNWTATWETCTYTPDDLNTFIRDYLAPTIAAASPTTKLLAPETIDWSSLTSFADPLLADPATTAALSIIAVHDYGGTPFDYTNSAQNGKEFWETEVSYDDATGIYAALETAREIQRHFVDGNVNAFHYWWLLADSDGNGGLLANGVPTPQAYGFAQYSKFIRPGYVRLDTPSTEPTGVSISAFYDPVSFRTVVVAVNENQTAVDLSFRFSNVTAASIEPWLTTADLSLAAQPLVPFTSPFPYSLLPESVTTLVTVDDAAPPADNGGAGGELGQAGATNEGGVTNGGAANEDDAGARATGGSAHASGGTGAKSTSTKHPSGSGGSTSSSAGAAEAGADDLDGGVAGDGGTVHRVPGYYSPCVCSLPGSGRGGSATSAPLLALLGLWGCRRRSRRRSA